LADRWSCESYNPWTESESDAARLHSRSILPRWRIACEQTRDIPIQKASLNISLAMFQRHSLAAALLVVLGALAYSNSLSNEFVHDDNYQIVRNPYLHSDASLSRLLFSDVWGYQTPGRAGTSNYYRPLQMLAYRWIAQANGLSPSAFHWVNLALHLIVSATAYLMYWHLTRNYGLSLSAAVLFVLHPIHTEAVAWIASLPELGCALFYFLAFWFFVLSLPPVFPKAKPARKKKQIDRLKVPATVRIPWRISSLASFAVSLLFKEMALTLPILVAAFSFTFEPGKLSWKDRIRVGVQRSWPYLVVVAGYLLLRFQVLGFISKSQQVWSLSAWAQFLSILDLATQYWYKLLIPVNFNAFYTFHPVYGLYDGRAWVAIACVAGLVGLIWYGFRRAPLASFAAAWVFLTLLPVMNIRGVGVNVFTERYLYIPSWGFCLVVAWLAAQGLSMLPRPLRICAAVTGLAGISSLYGMQTVRRNRDWKNDLVFYTRAAEASPDSSLMQNSLAHILRAEKGDLDGAERHALRALKLSETETPRDTRAEASAYLNLANIHIQRQEFSKALAMAEMGLAADRSQLNLHSVHGVALMQLGRIEQAQQVFLYVHQLLPNDELVLHYLGVIALQRREFEKAVDYFQKALKILPSYADAHNNLAAVYVEMGRLNEALPHLEQAARLNARDPMAHTNLGAVLAGLGRFPEARSSLQQALVLAPNFPAAMAELAALENATRRSP
jgi:protein O-mannosyl-transferase